MRSSEINRINERKNQIKRKTTIKKEPTLTLARSKTFSNKIPDNNSISIYPKGYAEPIQITQKQNNAIIINQQLPTETPISFSKDPVKMKCPYCLQNITSEVEKKCNCLTCLFYLFAIILCAIPLLICAGICNSATGLNINPSCDCECCCDIEHICPNCGKNIGSYNSCPMGW